MGFQKGYTPWNKSETNSICKVCDRKFHISPSRLKDIKTKRGIYCSRLCSDEGKIGRTAWNKGRKGWQKNHNISGLELGRGWNFKNGEAGYTALHQWIRRRLGKAKECIFCGSNINVQYASKSRKYKWNLNDWVALCQKCHGKYDTGKRGAIKKTYGKYGT